MEDADERRLTHCEYRSITQDKSVSTFDQAVNALMERDDIYATAPSKRITSACSVSMKIMVFAAVRSADSICAKINIRFFVDVPLVTLMLYPVALVIFPEVCHSSSDHFSPPLRSDRLIVFRSLPSCNLGGDDLRNFGVSQKSLTELSSVFANESFQSIVGSQTIHTEFRQ